jgi:hypothetical protein
VHPWTAVHRGQKTVGVEGSCWVTVFVLPTWDHPVKVSW